MYALIAENGQRYIGSAVNIQRRIKQHNKKILDNSAGRKLRNHTFECVILEKMPFGTTPRQLIACEEKHINECSKEMCLNEIKHDLTIWNYSRADTPIFPPRKTAVAKYNAKAYDRIEMKVRKGEKAAIVAHAEKMGETLNKFLNRAVRQTVQSDGGELTVPPNSEEPAQSGEPSEETQSAE